MRPSVPGYPVVLHDQKTDRRQFYRVASDRLTLPDGSEIYRSHTLGLRASDTLHLAVAAEHGATVQTLDQRLAAAGPVLGVMTKLMM